jgi:hypothetical protein
VLLNGNADGEEAGHLIYYFTQGDVHDISLHAWASRQRFASVNRVITAVQPGPAMPHVIATLKAIVGSATGK